MDQTLKVELIKKIEKREIKTSLAVWKFLNENHLFEINNSYGKTRTEKLYNWLYEVNEKKCKHCGSTNVSFSNFTKGYLKFCSAKCSGDWYRENETPEQNKLKSMNISNSLNKKTSIEWKEIHIKQSETKFKKYGDKNYNNKIKQQNTMKEKYGYKSPLQVPRFNKKFMDTLKNKDWDNSNKLRKETLLKKTGFEHQSYDPIVRNKTTNTMIEKYGVENPSQVPEFAEKKLKSSYLKKEYTLPSGKIELVQGYEGFEIDRLLTIYDEDDLILNQLDMPEVWYEYEGKKCRYIPDIYIPKDNKIIEVKSDHTMKLHLERNWLKKKRCIELSYDFEFRIYDNKMNLIDEKEFIL